MWIIQGSTPWAVCVTTPSPSSLGLAFVMSITPRCELCPLSPPWYILLLFSLSNPPLFTTFHALVLKFTLYTRYIRQREESTTIKAWWRKKEKKIALVHWIHCGAELFGNTGSVHFLFSSWWLQFACGVSSVSCCASLRGTKLKSRSYCGARQKIIIIIIKKQASALKNSDMWSFWQNNLLFYNTNCASEKET